MYYPIVTGLSDVVHLDFLQTRVCGNSRVSWASRRGFGIARRQVPLYGADGNSVAAHCTYVLVDLAPLVIVPMFWAVLGPLRTSEEVGVPEGKTAVA